MNRRAASALLAVSSALILLAVAACGICLFGTAPAVTGDPTVGAAIFDAVCSRCHSVQFIKPFADLLTNNMGDLNPAMKGITLTDQDIADLRAFLATQ
ncbi:MAG TPA: hypothetical protein VMV94_09645 [Phycisphaerae bacterium]|nr:hypothetical protein [Phycisphaerae bacterium]